MAFTWADQAQPEQDTGQGFKWADEAPQAPAQAPQASPEGFTGTLQDIYQHGGERLSKLGDQLKQEFTSGEAVKPLGGGIAPPEYSPDDSTAMQYLKAAGRTGAGLYNMTTSPAGLATVGSFALGQPEIGAGLIAAQMAPQAVPMAQQTYKAATGQLPPGESAEAGLNLGMLAAPLMHGVAKGPAGFEPVVPNVDAAVRESIAQPEPQPVAAEPPPIKRVSPETGEEFVVDPKTGEAIQPQAAQAAIPTPDEFGREISQSATARPGETAPGHEPSLAQEEPSVAQPQDQGVVTGSGQEAPIGASNRVSQAREEASLLGEEGAPESGVGIGYRDSVAEGNQLIDKGVSAYKVASEFQANGLINRQRMGVMRAQLERLQVENAKALGDVEANPADPALQQRFQDTSAAENSFWRAYQPMKTEWSNIGTGMQETRGISDADVMSQATAEAAMRDSLNRELTPSDKIRATRVVTDVRNAGSEYQTAMQRALDVASERGRLQPRGMKALAADLAETLKAITC